MATIKIQENPQIDPNWAAGSFWSRSEKCFGSPNTVEPLKLNWLKTLNQAMPQQLDNL